MIYLYLWLGASFGFMVGFLARGLFGDKQRPGKCKWTYDLRWLYDSEGAWKTECGSAWTFSTGGPKENGVKYCHKCGRLIKEK